MILKASEPSATKTLLKTFDKVLDCRKCLVCMAFKGQHSFGSASGNINKDATSGESTHLPQKKPKEQSAKVSPSDCQELPLSFLHSISSDKSST